MEAIISAACTGFLTLIGVIYATKKQHSSTIQEMKSEIKLVKEDVNNKVELIQKDIVTLNKSVEKHNKVIERTFALETNIRVLDEKQNNTNRRLDDLEAAN